MRRFLIALALPVLVLPAAHAQEVSTEELIVQEIIPGLTSTEDVTPEEALGEIRTGFNLSSGEFDALDAFTLEAQGNLALVRQEGEGNEAFVSQDGTGNAAVLLQLGDGNIVAAEQLGTGNVLGVQIEGNYNTLTGAAGAPGVLQDGDGNVYLLEFTGNNHDIPPAVQQGVGNQAIQTGVIDRPFGIEQYGDGMRMIIRHNGVE